MSEVGEEQEVTNGEELFHQSATTLTSKIVFEVFSQELRGVKEKLQIGQRKPFIELCLEVLKSNKSFESEMILGQLSLGESPRSCHELVAQLDKICTDHWLFVMIIILMKPRPRRRIKEEEGCLLSTRGTALASDKSRDVQTKVLGKFFRHRSSFATLLQKIVLYQSTIN